MNKAMQWLAITWPVLAISAALVVAGLFVASGGGVGAIIGLAMAAFGLYWGYRGTTPERDPR